LINHYKKEAKDEEIKDVKKRMCKLGNLESIGTLPHALYAPMDKKREDER